MKNDKKNPPKKMSVDDENDNDDEVVLSCNEMEGVPMAVEILLISNTYLFIFFSFKPCCSSRVVASTCLLISRP